VDTVAQAAITSHLQDLLSEHILHGVTFLGHLFTLLGFLYLSYDLLGKPRGILNWLLIIFTHLVVCIFVLAVFSPPILFLFQKALQATHTPANIVDPITQIGDIVVYTLMIGVMQGTLIAFPPAGRTSKRVEWRDSLIGLIFALVFFSIDEYGVFRTPIGDVSVIPDLLLFVCIGSAGAGLWRKYHQAPHHLTRSSVSAQKGVAPPVEKMMYENGEPLPSFFSFAEFIRGLLYWYTIVVLSTILWAALYIIYYGLTGQLLFYVVDLLIGPAPASLVCGTSQYITWKVQRLGEKQLGVVGAIVTLIGLVLVLLEPLVLFLTPR
jgi:hypothetical protein